MASIMHLMQERRPLRVTLETADGTVITGMVYAASVNMRQDISDYQVYGDVYPRQIMGATHWDISLTGTGSMEMTAQQAAIAAYGKRSAIEWKCDYCGAVHARAQTKCCGCGASRSFVYG